MWKSYKIGLTGTEMSFVAKIIVWLMAWQWVDFILMFIIDVPTELMFQKTAFIIALYAILGLVAKYTRIDSAIEAYIYIKSILTNKQPIVEYYIPDGCEPDDHSKWIYKV